MSGSAGLKPGWPGGVEAPPPLARGGLQAARPAGGGTQQSRTVASRVRPLAGSLTDASEKGARVQQRRAAEGFKEGERTYAGRLAAVAGNTYALRSVNYDGSDVLVAFRVVRADDDGSVVLLWKMLKRFPKPTLDRSASVAEH